MSEYQALEQVTACGKSMLRRYRTFDSYAKGRAWLRNNQSGWHYGLVRADRVADVMYRFTEQNN